MEIPVFWIPVSIAIASALGVSWLKIFAEVQPKTYPSHGKPSPAIIIYNYKFQFKLSLISDQWMILVHTCHENKENKYKFVMMAKITMNKIRNSENGLIIRTRSLAVRGMYFWIKIPISKGTINPTADDMMFVYGILKFARSKIVFPSVKIHSGIIAKANSVEIVVIAMDKLMLAPNKSAHIFDAPPPGLTPVKNSPSANSGLSENKMWPNP